jgi:hypothetical protein
MAGSFLFEAPIMAMKRLWTWTALTCFCFALVAGCGGDREKGANRGLDRPQPETKKN